MGRLTRGDLGDLNMFRQIAESGGFRKAAALLDVSPSALSHAMRGLEARQGVRLFNRTNRAVTLTPAGVELLARLDTGFNEIELGLEQLNRYRDRPAGQLRLNVFSDAARLVLAPILAEYSNTYPDVRTEVMVQDRVVDIVNEGFDAGIRYGGLVPEDMIAIPLGPELRWIAVASPAYLQSAPRLETPSDLAEHKCIGIRMGNGQIYRWELERGDEADVVAVDWVMVVNETVMTIELAETGGGVAYCLEQRVTRQLADGSLVRVLPAWSSMGPAFHLYYPSRRQLPEALRALLRLIQARSE
ncbi:LysR substrate-binding domain-containing protein [Pseudoxanthomonas sp.]|uniref:LysR substrate-binding domain-containing protein n=1 Tax=Pseudoxanthomonas sp. TaxID=1871049 RepID=UPI00263423AC|nr:LysR substrate-binding domain-containing protein [Pseudoxanthomonas sp.]WDS34676.1 MAG: LysR substrate-binding domain-containing protein [Pseudoxanthomonas sp.]